MNKTIIVLFLCLFQLVCVNNYNPFSDYNNAKTLIKSKSFKDSQSLEIFSTESIKIAITVPNLIDSVKVRAAKNMLFSNGQWLANSDSLKLSRLYTLCFSFYDTGLQNIDFMTYRNNGDSVKMTLQCYLKSPLNPQLVKGNLGEKVILFTPGVKDDVPYEWNFDGQIFTTYFNNDSVIIQNVKNSGRGLLSVFYGKARSPNVEFDYVFSDFLSPLILLLPITYTVSGDTVKTSHKNIYFSVNIKDRGGNEIDSVSINGTSFDIVQNDIYTKIFYGLDTLRKPLPLNIFAYDDFRYRNVASANYLLVYDSIMQNKTGVQIVIISPTDDFSTVLTATKDVIVKMNKYTDKYNDAKIVFECNGKKVDAEQKDEIWVGTVPLKHGNNKINIKAVDNNSISIIDSVSRTIMFDSTGIDSTNPVILEIRANGEVINGWEHSAVSNKVLLSIIAFDEASGVKNVRINNNEEFSAVTKYFWTKKLFINHNTDGQMFVVDICDNFNNYAKKEIRLFYNNKPGLIKKPNSPRMMMIGQVYKDTIIARDIDGDILKYQMSDKSKMTITNDGIIQYKPDALDIGKRNFTIIVDDGFKYNPYFYSFDILVVDTSQVPVPVKFLSTEDSLPLVLPFGKSITCNLKLNSNTGVAPFILKAVNLKNNKEFSVNSQNLSVTFNHSDSSDTGIVPCLITVTDSLLTSDTLVLSLHVVSLKQKPLELVKHPGYYADKIIDLQKSGVFKFQINDTMLNYNRSCSVYVKQNRISTSYPFNSFSKDTFALVLNPVANSKIYDTIMVTVKNTVGEISCTLNVFYGNFLDTVSLWLPLDSTFSNDTNITFSWKPYQDTSVKYELYYGIYPSLDKKVIMDTSCSIQRISKTGTYGWKVVAFNQYSRIESKIRTVVFENPFHIRLNRDSIKIKTEYKAQKDTIDISLSVFKKTVTDSAYQCFFENNRSKFLPVSGSKLKYLPQISDTGYQWLVITVKDDAGNADTIKKMILIYSEDENRIILKEDSNRMINGSEIDYRKRYYPDTLVFICCENAHVTSISSKYIQYQSMSRDGKDVAVIIDPDQAVLTEDSLIVLGISNGKEQKLIYNMIFGTLPVIDENPMPCENCFVEGTLDSLKWNYSDYDMSKTTFDLYFGENQVPPLLESSLTDNIYRFNESIKPGIYYWKIVAHNRRFSSESPVWKILVNTHIIKINTEDVGLTENLINFPLLIRTDGYTNNNETQSVSFRKGSDFSVELAYQLDSREKESAVWLLMDTIKQNDSTQFVYMVKNGISTLSSNGEAVFDTANGFQAVWHLQGDTGITASGSEFDATVNKFHGQNFTGGKSTLFIGNAPTFESINKDYISIPENSEIGKSGDQFNVEAWVKFTNLSKYGTITALLNSSSSDTTEYSLSIRDSSVYIAIHQVNDEVDTLNSSKSIGDGRWHHIIGTVNFLSGVLSIYIDGQLDTSKTVSGLDKESWNLTHIIKIGSDNDTARYFNGSIDELRVVNKSRSSDWIRFSYENQRNDRIKPVVKIITPNE